MFFKKVETDQHLQHTESDTRQVSGQLKMSNPDKVTDTYKLSSSKVEEDCYQFKAILCHIVSPGIAWSTEKDCNKAVSSKLKYLFLEREGRV